jgi:hypothetical protein
MADISPTLNLIDSALGTATPAGADASAAKSVAQSAIDTIDAGLAGKLPEATKPYETTARSLGMNAISRANEALADFAGMPVDAVTWLANHGPSRLLGNNAPPIENPIGGSESIKRGMGLINADPDKVQPQNLAEKIAGGIGGGAASAVLLPLGGEALAAGKVITPAANAALRSAVGAPDALNATMGAASGAGAAVGEEVAPEHLKPLGAIGGGLVGGSPVLAGHVLYEGARAAGKAITDRLTEEGAKRVVGKEMAAAATDQAAARENLANQPHEIVPGSVGTTGQIAGDTGLLNWERGVRQQNPAEFNNRDAAQNSAQIAHLESVQPTGNAADLPGVIAGQREAAAKAVQANTGVVEALSNASVKSAEAGQKNALEGLKTLAPDASPAEVSGHFRNMREALDRFTQAEVDKAQAAAEAARGKIPANRPEDVGAALRAPAQEARNAAKEQENALWKAVDPNGTLSVSMGPIQQAKNAIYGNITKAGEASLSPAERSLTGVIDQYGHVESFRELTDLRSSVSSAMREELRNSGRTPAYARLTQLRQGIENAIDSAVEGRAVQEHGAVARGNLFPADTMAARIRKVANGDVVAEPNEPSAPSLLQFIASKGGLGPDAELEAIGAHNHVVNVEGAGRRKLVRQGGWPLDYAREAAEEAGYLRGDHNGTSTVKDLLDAIDAEMRGQKRYPEGFEGSASKREITAAQERENHDHERFIRGYEDDLRDAGHGELGADIRQRAVHLMENEGMDADMAVEAALRQMDHEEGHAEIYAGPSSENGLPSGKGGGGGNGPEKGQAEGFGARSSSVGLEAQGIPDEEAGQRLRAASAATRERAQTFDQGATGKLLKPGATAGEYKLSDAKAAAVIFHPGDTGGEDVRAYVKAVGPEKANAALSDAAAASLHEKAIRPDGTLDPKKVDAWLAAHKTAIAELPASTRAKFESAANAQRAVEDAFAKRREAIDNFNKSEAGKVADLKDPGDIVREVGSIISSKDGAKRMGELAQAAKDNPAAKEGLQRAVVEHVMNKFLPEQLEKAQAFIKDKADVLSKVFTPKELDGIASKIEAAQTAGTRLEAAKVNRETALKEAQASEKEALSRYDQTVLGKIMKTEGTANVLDKLGTIFGSSDSAKQMGLLAEEAAKVKGGSDALRKAVTEMIKRDYSTSAEVGTSGEKGLSRAALDKFMKENTETLEKVLSPEQVGKLRAIIEDQLRANRSITATKLKGGSDTAQNQIAAGKLTNGSVLGYLAREFAAKAAGTTAGFALGGPLGAIFGKEGGELGAKAMAALRDAGLNRLSEIRIRAALDPQFGKALLDDVPKYPDRNAAALIALRAKQLSVAGTMAGVRQQQH